MASENFAGYPAASGLRSHFGTKAEQATAGSFILQKMEESLYVSRWRIDRKIKRPNGSAG